MQRYVARAAGVAEEVAAAAWGWGFSVTYGVLGIALALMMAAQPQQNVPDAPAPGAPDAPSASTDAVPSLGNLKNEVAPGKATAADTAQPDGVAAGGPSTSTTTASPVTPAAAASQDTQQEPPEVVGAGGDVYKFTARVNLVLVPVTVRDSKHQLVAGLDWRDFRIFENNLPQRISVFSVTPQPLSVALVIDQSVPVDTMKKVNDSLAALTGAFAPFDEVSVFTYNKFIQQATDFTAAQGARLPAIMSRVKAPGRDMGAGYESGPLATGPIINGQNIDPNLNMQRNNSSTIQIAPKEYHPLNDAILAAAKSLASQPRERRRIIYVISDGKEAGSKASHKEVVQFLLGNNIAVYGTLVGDSATWGLGYLDKVKLPFLPTNNILPKYTVVTGGSLEAEFSTTGIERSFAEITSSIRNQYLLGYNSHEPFIDGKWRPIDVRTPNRPGLDIIAKSGYYPSAGIR
ncbi:MAG TPA: VWA domain-containing protein [Acidisarcina sp.]